MSRHTLNDGKTPDVRLTSDIFNIHAPELAVPAKLVWKYYRNEITFDDYAKEYIHYLSNSQNEKVVMLIKEALIRNITVMCIEETPEKCHRRIFIEYCQWVANNLWIQLESHIS